MGRVASVLKYLVTWVNWSALSFACVLFIIVKKRRSRGSSGASFLPGVWFLQTERTTALSQPTVLTLQLNPANRNLLPHKCHFCLPKLSIGNLCQLIALQKKTCFLRDFADFAETGICDSCQKLWPKWWGIHSVWSWKESLMSQICLMWIVHILQCQINSLSDTAIPYDYCVLRLAWISEDR